MTISSLSIRSVATIRISRRLAVRQWSLSSPCRSLSNQYRLQRGQGQPPDGPHIACRGENHVHHVVHIFGWSTCDTMSHKHALSEVAKGSHTVDVDAAVVVHTESRCDHHEVSTHDKLVSCNTCTFRRKPVHGSTLLLTQEPFLNNKGPRLLYHQYPRQVVQRSHQSIRTRAHGPLAM